MLDIILENINTVVIVLVSTVLTFQMLYFFSFPFKSKKYPEAKKYHKFAVVISARNEEKVIGNLVDSLMQQDYPKEYLDVFVICHNCTDNTKEIATEHGAKVFVVNDDNPKHKRKGYALHEAFKKLLTEEYDHEGYVFFDADNLAKRNCIRKMNDAFDSGVKIGQGFINAKNLEDNLISEVNGIFHLRNASFNNKARTLIHSSVISYGTGSFFSREVIESLGGWNCFSYTEDAEFAIQYILKDYSAKAVDDAEFYDEQPTSFMGSLNRQARMGRGAFGLFFKYSPRLLWKFITTLKFKYLDFFLNFLYAPISVITMLWFPAYYTYVPVKMLINGQYADLNNFLIMVAIMVGVCIILPVTLQNIVAYIVNRKRLNITSFWKTVGGLLLFPFYNLCYALSITIGIFTPNFKWKRIDHNRGYTIADMKDAEDDIEPKPKEERKIKKNISPQIAITKVDKEIKRQKII